MDNREENSRSTEQDRVANPVEETVSTTVEPALSENKRERKKREKAEKEKNYKEFYQNMADKYKTAYNIKRKYNIILNKING